MMGDGAVSIASFLTERAQRKILTTYPDVAQATGFGSKTGQGLGKYLWEIVDICVRNGLPLLTMIVVVKGTRNPKPKALEDAAIHMIGKTIDQVQREVFAFDWSTVSDFSSPEVELPLGKPVWLTSFWGFAPESWGCIGFTNEHMRKTFLRSTKGETALVYIYVTKTKGPKNMRGKVVGFYEITRQIGFIESFVAADILAKSQVEAGERGKWRFSLKASRAWRIAEEDWKPVEELFPASYYNDKARHIGAQGVQVQPDEVERLLALTVYEVPVYGQTGKIDSALMTFENVLTPSKAVYPATEPYWVGETDGPKHLYILYLAGDIAAYLNRKPEQVEGKRIFKVGFSKSPLSRRDQIQAAYPAGSFKWQVLHPKEVPVDPPYPNAEVAIAGEDAMKKRLQDGGCESLGGEFYLADENFISLAWGAGLNAAGKKMK